VLLNLNGLNLIGVIGTHLPDGKAFRHAEVLIDHLAGLAGKCHFHN